MKPTSILKVLILTTALAGTAATADKGATRSMDSLPAAHLTSQASEKSQGLPNADGHKPGKGYGYGHDKDKGEGHERGRGHGHDDDHYDSPG